MGRTNERRHKASDPAKSAWVSANAGSGKTYTLANRVARLLLNEVKPERILCLTYTKAAAAEMQSRLFKQLGRWAMADDETLVEKIDKHRRRHAGSRSGESPAAVRACAGNAGRAEDQHHPFLLPISARALSTGGRRAAGLSRT